MTKQSKREIPTYYAIIPAEVRYCKEIPFGARLLFGEIMALANKNGYCWASNDYFGELYDVHQTTITEWVAVLKKYGFINYTLSGLNRKITVQTTLRKKPVTSKEKNLEEGKEKHLDNNTSNNNINNIAEAQQSLKETKKETTPFKASDIIQGWVNSPQNWLKIIGLFAKFKDIHDKFKTKGQLDLLIPKYRKVATELSEFSGSQLKEAFEKCAEMRGRQGEKIDWTLFTVKSVLLK